MNSTTRNRCKKALAIVGVALNVAILSALLLFLLVGCTGSFGPHSPKPPRGHYSLEQAQRWVEHMNSADMRNRGYRQVK